ncbi:MULTISPECIES: hypothetical protein [unclassified Streptomyces]|uniref:hypothetical protein n=1 Tax=unclassified Streptomyces TaxID=2593676 RepID=UPI002E820387|nr:hypothetical protein [Streptomyces sp. NBC_00589]WTI33520.1 hypothetical protein OIC96_00025 [Streptomyces sp. NBC_00775]WTI42407.1 hypothetical protein OIC96_49705 [Streptomyces sp. NBC_00775]WUB23911.1 hypothetical protein OHA51_00025 [Streptomyces sp. NBC_00589]
MWPWQVRGRNGTHAESAAQEQVALHRVLEQAWVQVEFVVGSGRPLDLVGGFEGVKVWLVRSGQDVCGLDVPRAFLVVARAFGIWGDEDLLAGVGQDEGARQSEDTGQDGPAVSPLWVSEQPAQRFCGQMRDPLNAVEWR